MKPTMFIFPILVLIFVIVGGTIVRRLLARSAKPLVETSYEAIPSLLSPAERSFFGVLQQAAASEYQIFSKVRVADIVLPVKSQSRSAWQSAFNRITGKHVDRRSSQLRND